MGAKHRRNRGLTPGQDTIDIGAFVESGIDARRSAAQHGVTLSVDQLPVFGITKDALLALRYRPSDGQVRLRCCTSDASLVLITPRVAASSFALTLRRLAAKWLVPSSAGVWSFKTSDPAPQHQTAPDQRQPYNPSDY